MKLLKKYLSYKWKTIALLFVFFVIFMTAFYLYRLPLGAVIYPSCLALFIGIVFMIVDFMGEKKRHEKFEGLKAGEYAIIDDIPEADSIMASDLEDVISGLIEESGKTAAEQGEKFSDMVEYYTVWAHQIKTPIASMRLSLENEDSSLSRKLKIDLSRIEAYVNMVLTYLRLDSDSTDYVFREHDMDEILKPVIRKFAADFISKGLSLKYEAVNRKVLTDDKWLSFVIEQLISNAVKYTEKGSVSIYMRDDVLYIEDSGIGISREDLPRVFDKGYTGFNGRKDKRASGIGLYLSKRVCDRLGAEISAESEVGKGTIMKITMNERKMFHE